VAILFALVALGLAWLLSPRKPNPVKTSTYECGIETIGDTWVQFRAQYYIYALVFVVFDIEAVFLFPGQSPMAPKASACGPWARRPVPGHLDGRPVYAWRKGALRWM